MAAADLHLLLPQRKLGDELVVEHPSPVYRVPAGFSVRRYLALPPASPRVYVPAGSRPAVRAVFDAHVAPVRPRLRAARGLAVAAAPLAARAVPRVSVLVASRSDRPPFPLAAAREVGLDPASPWYLWSPDGRPEDKLALFHVLGDEPAVVAVAHFEEQQQLVDDHLRGRSAAVDAGSIVTAHVPALVGSFTAEGLPALATRRAPGHPLEQLLRRGEARGLVETIVDWLCDVARTTTAPPETLAELRQRLCLRVVPEWSALGADAEQLDRAIEDVSATFAHGDLHPRNVIVDGAQFQLIDLDRAQRHGFPLWDLWFFLADAYAVLDGATDRVAHFADLFGGRVTGSTALFDATRRVAQAAGVPLAVVPALATLCWLDLGLPRWLVSDDPHGSLPEWATGRPVLEQLLAYDRIATRAAVRWLEDPALGSGWAAWSARL